MNKSLLIIIIQLVMYGNIMIHAQWIIGNDYPTSISSLFANDEIIIAGTYNHEVFLSTNNGYNWTLVNNTLSNITIQEFASQGNYIFAVASWGGVWRTTDNGYNWKEVNNGITNNSTIAIITIGDSIYVGTYGSGVFKSFDSGSNWRQVNDGLTNLVIRAFATIGENLFVATDIGVFVSTNYGSTWEIASNGLPGSRILALTSSGETIFAASDVGIFLSTDNGKNWTPANNGLQSHRIWELTSYGSYIFAGIIESEERRNNGGVFLSKDNGANWKGINDELTFRHITELSVNNEYIFAGNNGGIFYHDLSTLITDINYNVEEIPNKYNVKQNYPNPFNPTTTISYSIPQREFVQLKVYDVLGKKIATLVNEEKAKGKYKLDFDASNLSSGVYFYRLQSGDFVDTKKLILLR